MAKIDITVAGGRYDRVEELVYGIANAEGINLNYLTLEPDEIFWRMLNYKEFDASEMSLAAYVILTSRGNMDDFIGLPVFTSKMFRHSSIYVKDGGRISSPDDLAGSRIGMPEFQMTMSVWVRGFLNSEYNLNLDDITWYLGGIDRAGRKERFELKNNRFKIIHVEDQALSEMLLNDELDAICSAYMPDKFKKQEGIVRLFNDYRKEEIEFYIKTGVVPIMHLVVVKKKLLEKYPWIAVSLYKAYDTAMKKAYARLYNTDALPVSLLWLSDYIEQEKKLFGDDLENIWSNGLGNNLKSIKLFVEYCKVQDLLEKDIEINDLFVNSLRENHAFK